MNKQELINVPRILFPIGTEILIKGKIVGLKVLDDRFVENVVKLDYGEQIIAPNDAIYVKDEPQPVKVPQFVADWIEEARKACKDVVDFFEFNFTNDEVGKWFMQELPFDLAARAWLDGYEVEEEKRYTVVMKETKQPLYYNAVDKKLFFSMGGLATKFTRKQLEEAGLGWVFDCEGIEIEEVE
ncbi:TPA: DUF1642 domain-containing protein [Streptococcus pneumoniae]